MSPFAQDKQGDEQLFVAHKSKCNKIFGLLVIIFYIFMGQKCGSSYMLWDKNKTYSNIFYFRPFYLRYVTLLTLVRVRKEQKGRYSVLVTNGDDTKEVTFDLEVQGERLF